MATIGFQLATPATSSGGKIPSTVEKAMASGYAEAQGALLVVNGSDQYAGCGADPTSIAAVSLTPGGADSSGFVMLGRKEFPPNFMQGIAIKGQKFIAPYIGTLPANPGGSFGTVRDTDGVWKVDFGETTTTSLVYLGVVDRRPDLTAAQEGLVLVQFKDSVVQAI